MEVQCLFCKILFQTTTYKFKRSKKHFCSKECYLKDKGNEKILLNCEECGVLYKTPHQKFENNNKNYCSNKCRYKKLENCINCGKKKNGCSKIYCESCYRKEYYKNNPEKRDKKRKTSLENKRKKLGIPIDAPLLKNKNGFGGINGCGYKIYYKPDHFASNKISGKITEHKMIMCEFLGRNLYKEENIHHKNGDRLDNRLENLELWSKHQPNGQRVKDKIKFYKEFLEKYGAEVNLDSVPDILQNYES